jgi:glutamate/tyrosine decarboxylase-like PLP-dependent enzyme
MNRKEVFGAPLEAAMQHAFEFVAGQDERGVDVTVTLQELRQRIDVPLADAPIDAKQVVDELAAAVEGGIVGSAGPRFFGFVIGGSLPAALAADWLTSTWDQNSGLYDAGSAAAIVEETAGKWLLEVLGLPTTASFAFVTGCQMAHTTCLAAARNAVLARHGWDVEQSGLCGAPVVRIVTSNEQHATVARAARLLGLGKGNIVALQAKDDATLAPDVLEAELEKYPGQPTIVVLQAGDVNTGAFDDFQALIPIAKRYGAWVHVDGAFGLWAAASAKYAHLLAGANKADSWATDGHKWLNVPYDCGYAFVTDRKAHFNSMSVRAAYLNQSTAARDQVDWTPEFSRRGRGFATYAALRQLGRHGVAELVERCCKHAHDLVLRIGELPGAHAYKVPLINQGLLRFRDLSDEANEAANDAFTDRVMVAIRESGEAFFTGTSWRGKRYMRVSVSNWQTSEADVVRVVT